jgi:predicted regulator of Ras-like GTPase activity (Roadblock/LC7/MglB family)
MARKYQGDEEMISLRETLQSMVETVGGGIGAVIMGYDGIAIDEHITPDAAFDVQLLSVEYSNLLKEIKQAVDILRTGSMEEVAINTDVSRVLIRVINDDYFLVFVLNADGNFGKGRYLMKKFAPQFRESLQ